jgi:hypothetical protein
MRSSRQHAHHWPLWKRAILHGLKTLVRKHPRAALHAAGASVGYAGREVAHGGGEFVREKISAAARVFEPHQHAGKSETAVKPHRRRAKEKESETLMASLRPEDRRALARLAGKAESRTG